MEDSKELEIQSCEPTMTRQQFCETAIKAAKAAGVLLIAPVIADTFIVPAAFAGPSTCNINQTAVGNDTTGGTDFLTIGPHAGDNGTTAGHVESNCSSFRSDTGASGDPSGSGMLCSFLHC